MLIEVAIAVKAADQERLLEALAERAPRGVRFGVGYDRESGQLLLLGDSEDELESLFSKFGETGDIPFEVGSPRVAYRETLVRSATVRYTYKKLSGSSGQFAEVTIAFEPLPRGGGFVFENTAGDAIQPEFVPGVENGVRIQKELGLLAGFPVIDFKAMLVDAKYHEVDSSARTFDVAARLAFRELATKDVVKLLEPIMKVDVTTPDEFLGEVIGDLIFRRGALQRTETRGAMQAIIASVPLADMFGYSKTLKAMTRGKASFAMTFSHYDFATGRGGDDPPFRPAMAMRA